jgi:hypothetical protein
LDAAIYVSRSLKNCLVVAWVPISNRATVDFDI